MQDPFSEPTREEMRVFLDDLVSDLRSRAEPKLDQAMLDLTVDARAQYARAAEMFEAIRRAIGAG